MVAFLSRRILPVLAAASVATGTLVPASAHAEPNRYDDPEGRFSFEMPGHWRVERIGESPLHLRASGDEGAACVWTILESARARRPQQLEVLLANLGAAFPRAHLPYEVTRLERTDRRYRIGGEAAQFYEGSYMTADGFEGRLDVFVTFRPFGAVILSCTHDFQEIVWPEAAEQFRTVQTSMRFTGGGRYVIADRYRLPTGEQTATTRGN